MKRRKARKLPPPATPEHLAAVERTRLKNNAAIDSLRIQINRIAPKIAAEITEPNPLWNALFVGKTGDKR